MAISGNPARLGLKEMDCFEDDRMNTVETIICES